MVRYIFGLLIALTITGCTGISQYTAVLPGDKTVIYVMGVNKSLIGGTDLRICDRWVYDIKTRELKLEKGDSSSSESKSVMDMLKGLPVPIPIP